MSHPRVVVFATFGIPLGAGIIMAMTWRDDSDPKWLDQIENELGEDFFSDQISNEFDPVEVLIEDVSNKDELSNSRIKTKKAKLPKGRNLENKLSEFIGLIIVLVILFVILGWMQGNYEGMNGAGLSPVETRYSSQFSI